MGWVEEGVPVRAEAGKSIARPGSRRRYLPHRLPLRPSIPTINRQADRVPASAARAAVRPPPTRSLGPTPGNGGCRPRRLKPGTEGPRSSLPFLSVWGRKRPGGVRRPAPGLTRPAVGWELGRPSPLPAVGSVPPLFPLPPGRQSGSHFYFQAGRTTAVVETAPRGASSHPSIDRY